MEVLLTVSYVLDTEKYDFWDKETGRPKTDVLGELEKQFPEELSLTNKTQGKRSRLSYMPLGISSEKCPQCGRWMTARPEYYSTLPISKEINGKAYCESCAYDIRENDN